MELSHSWRNEHHLKMNGTHKLKTSTGSRLDIEGQPEIIRSELFLVRVGQLTSLLRDGSQTVYATCLMEKTRFNLQVLHVF